MWDVRGVMGVEGQAAGAMSSVEGVLRRKSEFITNIPDPLKFRPPVGSVENEVRERGWSGAAIPTFGDRDMSLSRRDDIAGLSQKMKGEK